MRRGDISISAFAPVPKRQITADNESLAVSSADCASGLMCFEEVRAEMFPMPLPPRTKDRHINSKGERLAFDQDALILAWEAGVDEKQFEEVRYETCSRLPYRADCVFVIPNVTEISETNPLLSSAAASAAAPPPPPPAAATTTTMMATEVVGKFAKASEAARNCFSAELGKYLFVHDSSSGKRTPEDLLELLKSAKHEGGDESCGEGKATVVKLSGDASYDLSTNLIARDDGDPNSVRIPCFKVGADTSVIAMFNMKVSCPAHWCEYYISSVISQRLGSSSGNTDALESAKQTLVKRRKVLQWTKAHFYDIDDVSVLLTSSPSWHSFTLHMLQRAFSESHSKYEEPLVLYIAVELLSIVGMLHNIGISLGNITTKSFCLNSASADTPETVLTSCTDYGWSTGGLACIDLSCATDTSPDAPDALIHYQEAPYSEDPETQANNEITTTIRGRNGVQGFDQDVHSIACTLHRLLHGADVSVSIQQRDPDKEWMFAAPLKRYWRTSIWTELFRSLLNTREAMNGTESADLLAKAREPLVKIIAEDEKLRREIRAQLGRALYILGDFTTARRKLETL